MGYEQEKGEHLEAVCNELNTGKSRAEKDWATGRVEVERSRAECARLAQELQKLSAERDSILGRTFVLTEQLKAAGNVVSDMDGMVG